MKKIKSASLVLALFLGIALSCTYASSALAAPANVNGEYHVEGTEEDGSSDETVMTFTLSGTKLTMESDGINFTGTYNPANGDASLTAPVADDDSLSFSMDIRFVEDGNSVSFSGLLYLLQNGEPTKSMRLDGGRIEG